MHCVIRDLLGFSPDKAGRSKAKGFTFALQYGGGESGICNSLKILGYPATEAKATAKKLAEGYIGTKRYFNGRTHYSGGLASSGYNALESRIYGESLRTMLFGRAAALPLQYRYRGKEFGLSVKNWVIQSTGSDFLRGTYALVRLIGEDMGKSPRPLVSVHDMTGFRSSVEEAGDVVQIMQAAHLVLVAWLYRNNGYSECPTAYALFDEVTVEDRLRLFPLEDYVTGSNPTGFPRSCCPLPQDLT
jgi:hypothetical protein